MTTADWRRFVLFLVLGFGLLLWSYYVTPGGKRGEFASLALISASFVLLAVALLNVAFWIAGGEPTALQLERLSTNLKGLGSDLLGSFEVLKDSNITGLQRILGTSRDFERKGDSWMGRLMSAREKVDLMGYSLFVWSTGQNFCDEMVRRPASHHSSAGHKR